MTAPFTETPPHPADTAQARPIVLSEISEHFDQEEQRLLDKKFKNVKDIEFDLSKQFPFLQRYCAEAQKCTDAKPQALVTSFLSALAANVGNRAFIQCGSRRHFCNIWSIVIGPSSISRKTTSLSLAVGALRSYNRFLRKEYLALMKEYNALAPERQADVEEPVRKYAIYPSAPAEQFLAILKENPNGILEFNEIADFLTKMNKSYNADFKAMITSMFDGIGTERSTRSYGDEYVENPAFSIATATTKEWLLKELDKEHDINSGFMQRFLMCNSNDIDFNALNFGFREGKTSEGVLDLVFEYFQELREMGSIEEPLQIFLSDEAKRLFEEENRAALKPYFDEKQTRMYSYVTRLFNDYFFRFCTLFTLIEYYERGKKADIKNLVVSGDIARYAHRLCYYYLHNVAGFLESELTDTRDDRNERAVVKAFQGWREREITDIITRTMLKNLSHINRKDFEEAVESLEEQQVLDVVKKKARNNKMTTYYRWILNEEKE